MVECGMLYGIHICCWTIHWALKWDSLYVVLVLIRGVQMVRVHNAMRPRLQISIRNAAGAQKNFQNPRFFLRFPGFFHVRLHTENFAKIQHIMYFDVAASRL